MSLQTQQYVYTNSNLSEYDVSYVMTVTHVTHWANIDVISWNWIDVCILFVFIFHEIRVWLVVQNKTENCTILMVYNRTPKGLVKSNTVNNYVLEICKRNGLFCNVRWCSIQIGYRSTHTHTTQGINENALLNARNRTYSICMQTCCTYRWLIFVWLLFVECCLLVWITLHRCAFLLQDSPDHKSQLPQTICNIRRIIYGTLRRVANSFSLENI